MRPSMGNWLRDEENLRLAAALALVMNWCAALAYLNHLLHRTSEVMRWSLALLGF
ncbi:MAG: hypothetical protein H5T97_08135 [Firmicutes bacterium]|nr:hypothetical protein [Bacillota bacterium]